MAKLIGYQFKLLWTQGKINHIADALSRSPVFDPEPEEEQDILACLVVVAQKVGDVSKEASKTNLAIKALTKHAVYRVGHIDWIGHLELCCLPY